MGTHTIGKGELEALDIPPALRAYDRVRRSAEESVREYEDALISFFTRHYRLFTPYEVYFKLRTYEFRILRQLMPSYFNPEEPYKAIAEIGCGFGYQALLLLPFCRTYLGIDIPEKFPGFVLGDFATSIDVAELLVRGKMGIDRAFFRKAWPGRTGLPSASVPLIFSEYTYNYIPELESAIHEAYRILDKSGVMIQILPNPANDVWEFISDHINLTPRKVLGFMKGIIWRSLGWRAKMPLAQICNEEKHLLRIRSGENEEKKIYLLEKYLFAMVDAGFEIENLSQIRESSHIIVARK